MADEDLEGAWLALAEQLIREAQSRGDFDHVQGMGQPIPGIDEPLSDDWWIAKKLKDEQLCVLPPILEVRLLRERLLERLPGINSEAAVRSELFRLNSLIEEAIRSPNPGPGVVSRVDVEATVILWKEQRAAAAPPRS